MATPAEIRAKLKEAESAQVVQPSGGDNAIYSFELKEGEQSTVRFRLMGIPNTFPWKTFDPTFAGVKVKRIPFKPQVPCMEMYGDSCPILSEVRGWFKDSSLEDMGRKYWKKRSYIFQGFVTENGLNEESTPENPVRRFIIGPQIFQLIKSALMDPDMEELPTDYTSGV